VVQEQARLKGSKLIARDKDFYIIEANNCFEWKGINHSIKKIKLPSHWALGEVNNLATALSALEASDASLLPTKKELNNALESFSLPGRFELIESKSRWILDVAHNPGAAKNFRDRLNTMKLEPGNTMIISMMRDKNLEDFIGVFKDMVSNWVVCKMDTDRSFTSQELKERLRLLGINDITLADSPYEAFKYVENLRPISDNIIVSGSFELVGPAKEYLSKTREI
jgi:dihydrofolate synthase/folylpolyglutamate synthase